LAATIFFTGSSLEGRFRGERFGGRDDAGHGWRLGHHPRQSFSPGWRASPNRSVTS
jgi:hypothetical protein